MSDAFVWFYETKGERLGPVTIEVIREMLRRGEVSEETPVWNPSFGQDWKPIRSTEAAPSVEVAASVSSTSSLPPLPSARMSDPSAGKALAVAILVGLFVIAGTKWLFSGGPARPEHSELSEAEFRAACATSEAFKKSCKGKFVIWSGRIYLSQDQKTYRVSVNGNLYDLLLRGNPTDASALYVDKFPDSGGAEVTFSGYLESLNWSIPDISSGVVTKITKSASEAMQENKEKRLAKEKTEDDKKRAEAQSWASKWGVSIDRYLKAEQKVTQLATHCKLKAAETNNLAWSEWESRGWLERDLKSWRMTDNNTVRISGDNLRTKRVGVPRVIEYRCVASIDADPEQVRLLSD